MANGGYHFVPVDDPAGRQSKKRPESQKYSREARKHVMKDIGLSRRKDRNGKGWQSKRIELKLVDGGPVNPLLGTGDETQLVHRPAALQQAQAEAIAESVHGAVNDDDLPMIDAVVASTSALGNCVSLLRKGCYLPGLARSLGSCRHDPFVKYPVRMTDRARFLLDTRKYQSHPDPAHRDICIHIYVSIQPPAMLDSVCMYFCHAVKSSRWCSGETMCGVAVVMSRCADRTCSSQPSCPRTSSLSDSVV